VQRYQHPESELLESTIQLHVFSVKAPIYKKIFVGTSRIDVLERRQFPRFDLLDDVLNSALARDIGFHDGDTALGSDVLEHLLRRSSISHDGEHVEFATESGGDDGNANVARGSDN
jgi:hypothetical protein